MEARWLSRSLGILALLFSLTGFSAPSWQQWLQDFKQEAVTDGIAPQLLDEVFSGWRPNPRVLKLDRNQPEKRLTFLKYRNTRGEPYRIKLGQRELKKHRYLLRDISQTYGVSPCFILSLWGLETSYGRYMGRFSTIKSLATLAFDSRRSQFFRKQLLYALHMVNDGHIHHKDLKGEWAGGTGHPQFLPSSWHHYAIDHDGDGRKDIWNNLGDVFASIANYLKQNGWQANTPWAIEVKLPRHFDMQQASLKIKKPAGEWLQQGVQIKKGEARPAAQLSASIIRPYGGPSFMVFNNFRVIMKWNRSTYYAGTVGYVADKICRRR